MDLRFRDARPSDEERAAIDAVLGAPEPGANGLTGVDGALRSARTGHDARARRDLLLPALHAVNDRVGWISEGALDHICRRLMIPPAEAYGVATFYAMFAVRPRPPRVLHVCTDLACRAKGSDAVTTRLAAAPPEGVEWHESPCLGLCERAPAALLLEAGEAPRATVFAPAGPDTDFTAGGAGVVGAVSPSGAAAQGEPTPGTAHGAATAGTAHGEPAAGPAHAGPAVVAAGGPAPAATANGAAGAPAGGEPGDGGEAPAGAAVPQAGDPGLVLLRRVGTIDPASLDDYRAAGGYTALRRALRLGPPGVIREVTEAGLVGRGGAAFPTGRKWDATARQPDHPHYLVCNADESEPGTFKDRVLMEGDPYALIEAMTIAGYAIGAPRGYIYLRGEYPRALRRLEHALARCRARGLLGDDILGQGVSFDVEIRRGAGAYICGEETAIFNSIEGYRGEPRSKPPFPVEKGLFGKPTAVNNVETLVNVLPILTGGAEAYAGTGTGGSTGTKLFCVSGTVRRPGLYELPFGATLRDLYEMAGGVPEGRSLRAVLLGGAAGSFVGPEQLDVPLTFEGTRAAGTTLGSGVVLVVDDTVDLGGVLLRIAAFFRDESCGQCVPCRVGTVRQEEALRRLVRGSGPADLVLLRDVGTAMRDSSICGLGQTAWNAVESAIDRLGVFTAGKEATP